LRRRSGRNSEKAERSEDGESDAAQEVHTGQDHDPLFQPAAINVKVKVRSLYQPEVGIGL